jgi:hypothetical protein
MPGKAVLRCPASQLRFDWQKNNLKEEITNKALKWKCRNDCST